MSDLTVGDGANVVMAICAVYAAWSAWMSSQKSKDADANAQRSANAAEKSASAAEKSAMLAEKTSALAQVGLLAEHFLKIDCIFDLAQGKHVSGSSKENSESGKQSAGYLKNIIHDPAFHTLLDEIIFLYNQRPVSFFTVGLDGTGKEKLKEQKARATQLRMTYEAIKRNCLNTNIG